MTASSVRRINPCLHPNIDVTKRQKKTSRSDQKENENPLHSLAPYSEDVVITTLTLSNRIWTINPKFIVPLRQLIEKTHRLAKEQAFKVVKNDFNVVCQIYDNVPPHKAVSYFKYSQTANDSKIFLETLMWNISQIFGYDRFAPTVDCTLALGGALLHGSLQPAIDGLSIEALLARNATCMIRFDSLVKASVLGALLCVWDWHPCNGIVDKRGLVNVFDNIRSLATSNKFITRPQYDSSAKGNIKRCTTPLRIFTTEIPESWEQLTAEQKESIASLVKYAKEKFEDLRKFLYSEEIQNHIKKLPEHWFDTSNILASMQSRITAIETALKEDKIHCLVDVLLFASSGYRISMGLRFAASLATRCQKEKNPPSDLRSFLSYFADVKGTPINGYFDVFNEYKISARPIVKLCENTSIPFLETARKIYTLVIENDTNKPAKTADKIFDLNQWLMQEFSDQSLPDWKDLLPLPPGTAPAQNVIPPKQPLQGPTTEIEYFNKEIVKIDREIKSLKQIIDFANKRLADEQAIQCSNEEFLKQLQLPTIAEIIEQKRDEFLKEVETLTSQKEEYQKKMADCCKNNH